MDFVHPQQVERGHGGLNRFSLTRHGQGPAASCPFIDYSKKALILTSPLEDLVAQVDRAVKG